ncbi:CBS domain-containing protein [bacterium]|nr:CBS domain-containing protein [bacterium]
MTIKELLKRKGSKVITAGENITVHEAVKIMVANLVGSVIVVDDHDHPVGIFTERDVLRQVDKDCKTLNTEILKNVMTTDLIICTSDEDTDVALEIITEKRLRHLPVMEGERIIGLVSIGDIVKTTLKDTKFEIHHMRDYIMGKF